MSKRKRKTTRYTKKYNKYVIDNELKKGNRISKNMLKNLSLEDTDVSFEDVIQDLDLDNGDGTMSITDTHLFIEDLKKVIKEHTGKTVIEGDVITDSNINLNMNNIITSNQQEEREGERGSNHRTKKVGHTNNDNNTLHNRKRRIPTKDEWTVIRRDTNYIQIDLFFRSKVYSDTKWWEGISSKMFIDNEIKQYFNEKIYVFPNVDSNNGGSTKYDNKLKFPISIYILLSTENSAYYVIDCMDCTQISKNVFIIV